MCSGMGFIRILLPNPGFNESMLISCGVDNKFVSLQNVLVDEVSCEYYKTYPKQISIP
jgi:hypothetical protein